MNPEKARALRDGHPRPSPKPFLPQPDTRKHRELRFDHVDPHAIARAVETLRELIGITVEAGVHPHSLRIAYELGQHTMRELEDVLVAQGVALDGSFLRRIERAIIHYTEETQLRNMTMPERLLKKSQQVYSTAWDKHLHGDHDETPPDLRQDR